MFWPIGCVDCCRAVRSGVVTLSIAEVVEIAGRVPAWRGRALEVEALAGGITNRNFVVRVDGGARYVVRFPGERTELLGIDRGGEREAAPRAAALGIGPAVVGELPGVGTPITELVPGLHLDGSDFGQASRRGRRRGAPLPRQRAARARLRDPSRRGGPRPRRRSPRHRFTAGVPGAGRAGGAHRGRVRGGAFAAGSVPQRPAAGERAVRRSAGVAARLRVRGRERPLLRSRQPQRQRRPRPRCRRAVAGAVLRRRHRRRRNGPACS